MDYNKLIERLYQHDKDYGEGRTQDFFRVCLDCKDAATALSTLQGENAKLRAELENYRKGHCSEGGCAAEKDRDAVLAELEQVKRERDAAIKEIFQWTGCPACKHWDSADNWCNKHDRSADSCDGCSTPEWHGLEKA